MIGEVFLFVLPTVGTVLCYGIVVWKVRKRKKHTVSAALTARSALNPERRMFTALFWIGIVTIVFWVPGVLFFLVIAVDPDLFNVTAAQVLLSLQSTSCVINPLIYHSSLPDIRRAINQLLGCRQ